MAGESNATLDQVAIPFTHHSHSGQFCGHAVDTLADCIESAIAKGMHTICLTEHIPRELADFYPEEENVHDETSLRKLFDDFYHEARRMQQRYVGRIQMLMGFESEWIRTSTHGIVQSLLEEYSFDMFVGSLHHVHTVPIDYDLPMYHKARAMAGGSDEKLFLDYFDSQFEMLQALRPPIIGHFDLIRLKSDAPNLGLNTLPTVWEKILRNLNFVAGYGGVLELNSSAIRKAMDEAYPQIDICKVSTSHAGPPSLYTSDCAPSGVSGHGRTVHCLRR